MSDHAVQKSDINEDQKLLLSNRNIREACLPSQSRWMAHWMQACSTSSSHGDKHHVVSGTSNNKEDHKKEQRYLLVESMKSEEANMLNGDVSKRNTFECITMQRFDPKELNRISNFFQSAEVAGAENEKCNIISNSMVRENGSSSDSKAVLSSKLSVQHLPDYSVNRKNFTTYHFVNSENVSSGWEHFPMSDTNRKIECILAPKNKSGYGTISRRMSEPHLPLSESTLAPHVIEFASEEHRFQPQSVSQSTNKGLCPCESISGLLPYGDDLTISSHSAIQRYKCNRLNMRSYMCTREENDPFIYKEHFARTNLTHLNHEICNCCNGSTFMVSEMKNDNEMIARSYGSSLSRLKDGSMQVLRDSCPGDTPLPVLAGERGKEIKTISSNELLPINKSTHVPSTVEDSGCVFLSHKMPKCSIHNVEALGSCTILNALDNTKVEPLTISNATQYFLSTKKMGLDLSHGDQMTGKSTISAEVKGTAFVEMPTSPTMSHCLCQHVANLQPPVSSTISEDREGVGIDNHFTETQNGSSDKTDIVYISQIPSSPTGLTSSSQKDIVCHNLTKSDSKSRSPIQQDFFRDATCASIRELSTSRMESLGADHIYSHFEQLDNSYPLQESASSIGPSNRWVKRLRHNPLDSLALVTKRFKTGDDSYRGQARNFSRILNYDNSSSCLSKHLEEQEEFDNTPLLTKNGECSSGESKAMNYWIRRWCCGSQQAAPLRQLAAPVLCEPVSLNAMHKNFEGKQSPSITAMALMGKATKNFRPCQFQRKGPLVVWNTEGL